MGPLVILSAILSSTNFGTRKKLSLWSSEDAIAVADKVMSLGTAEEVKQYLDSMKKEDE